MPDLKSEMSKVVEQWNSAEKPTTMTKTRGASTRAVFEYVRHNPGQTRAEVIEGVLLTGIPVSSASSLVSQLIINGNLRLNDGKVYANQLEYSPLKRLNAAAPRPKRGEPAPAPAEAPVEKPEFDADALLNSWSIVQARMVYDKLKRVFNG